MSRNFCIPLNRDDLFEASAVNQYIVENVYTVRELKMKLQDAQQDVQLHGADFVIDYDGFDIIFSVIDSFYKDITGDMKQQSMQITIDGMGNLIESLAQILNTGELLEHDERIRNLNKTKMLLYLFCQLIEHIEGDQSEIDPVTGKQQKGKKKVRDDDYSWNWDIERNRCVTMLYNLVQLNINILFDPPLVEEEVTNLIANTVFRILENPNLKNQNTRDSRLSIIQVLGTICKKYNYTLSCSLKFVQHLKHFDHLVSVFAQATEVMVRDFNCNAMVMELMREISRVDGKELARDTGGTNNYAKFLVEMTEKLPKNVMPCVSLLMVHLDGESYSMRKCVLGVLGEIVIKVLTGEDLDENNKDLRENFLDVLEDHMHDVSSYVRTRVLEIWDNLCEGKCIPLNRQHRVLELAVGRLQDKSSLVRKIAVRLLTSMLNCNPYAARFNNDQLKEALATETAKLEALVSEEVVSPTEQWGSIEENVKKGLVEEGQGDEKVWENASPGEVVERIAMFLEKGQIGKAVSLLEDAQEVMAGEEIFKPPQGEAEEPESENEDSEPDEGDEGGKEDGDKESGGKKASKKFPIFRNIFLESKKAPEISLSQSQEVSKEKQYEVQEKMVDYLKSSLNFNIILNKSLPVIAQLLGSKQETDILEGIDFFVSAFEFGVLNAMIGVRRMLSLIWSTEKKIKDAVVSAYKRLYINPNQNNARASAATIARNLMALVEGATLGDLTSMEKLVSELVASKDIGKDVFKVLWEFFIGVLTDVRSSDPKAAISLLAMAAISEPGIIRSNIEVIVNHGLGAKAESDFLLARESCVALLKLLPAKLKTDSPDPPTRFPPDHDIFTRLEVLLVTGIKRQKDPHFMPMAKQALNVIYQLAESPDVQAVSIIKQIFQNVQDSQNDESSGESRAGKVETFILRRICFLAGQIALCQMNFLDVNLFCELKRRNFLKEAKREKDRAEKDKENQKKKKRTSASSTQIRSASETPRNPGGAAGEDDDMGVVGAEADDAEAEFIRVVCEKELVTNDSMGANLLYLISPLILAVCRNPSKYKDPDLRASASLALSKYMLVSDEFCSTHLQLLFTVLEKSEEPIIRANLIIALGDLSFRYPNTLEPWTPKMYQRLHDTSVIVRSNTLTVLTHLILNDMIKVKGQISDMACCIVDDLERISGLSKLFFAELSKKGNTLYNVMPDIISRLSDPEVGVCEDDFRSILRYIIGLIEKDKMLEGLVEKLCHRFRATRTNRQWRDLAYCLSLFSFSDRSLRKLSDNFACWSDKLHEDNVYDSIIVILTAVKKGVGAGPVGGEKRTEAKQLAEELEARVEESRAKGVEDDTADKRAAEAKSKDAEEKAKGRKKTKKKEAEEEEDEEEEEPKETRKAGRRSGGRNAEAGEEEVDDRRKKSGRRRRNESSDEEEKTRKKKGSKTEEDESDEGSSPAGKGASKQVDDEDDSNEAKRRASHSPPTSSKKKGKSSSKKTPEPEPTPPKRTGRGNRKR